MLAATSLLTSPVAPATVGTPGGSPMINPGAAGQATSFAKALNGAARPHGTPPASTSDPTHASDPPTAAQTPAPADAAERPPSTATAASKGHANRKCAVAVSSTLAQAPIDKPETASDPAAADSDVDAIASTSLPQTSDANPAPSLQALLAGLQVPSTSPPVDGQSSALLGTRATPPEAGPERSAGRAVRALMRLNPEATGGPSTTPLADAQAAGEKPSANAGETGLASPPQALASGGAMGPDSGLAGSLPAAAWLLGPSALAASTAAGSSPAPAAAHAQIAASPGSPGFAPELGAQNSTFIKGGIQQAQLQLHPAEMGPVTVLILLEGAAAQVRLWADQGNTRQALEQAMPALAGSLREAGLTLTGGGVFEQPRQAPEQAWREATRSADYSRRGAAELAANAVLEPPAAQRRRGVVDLIA